MTSDGRTGWLALSTVGDGGRPAGALTPATEFESSKAAAEEEEEAAAATTVTMALAVAVSVMEVEGLAALEALAGEGSRLCPAEDLRLCPAEARDYALPTD